jgi:hypothetical protein
LGTGTARVSSKSRRIKDALIKALQPVALAQTLASFLNFLFMFPTFVKLSDHSKSWSYCLAKDEISFSGL